MNEFEAIKEIFLPLALGRKEALGFKDDAAFIDALALKDGIIITTDTIIEGVHFRPNDAPFTIGQKLVRVNLSDIIAKGGQVIGGFLNISWPKGRYINDLRQIAAGILHDQTTIGDNFPILGGDTTSHKGGLILSLTLIARPIKQMIKRANAQIGDILLVTGNIGDAYLGLKALENDLKHLPNAIEHYQTPKIPNQKMAQIIAENANAAMDVSDGLWGDAQKLLQNGQGVRIDLQKIPFSNEAQLAIKNGEDIFSLINFGDDYQCLCTIENEKLLQFLKSCEQAQIKITPIGEIVAENSGGLFNNGKKIDFLPKSYIHNF